MVRRRESYPLIMLESGEQAKIDIDATVSCKSSSSNSLEIRLKRDTEVLLSRQRDGSEDIIGSHRAPPFPIPHVLLKHIVSFDPHNINPLLSLSLQLDPVLCDHLSVKIATKAAENRLPRPLCISLHVTVTPHRFIGGDFPFPELDVEMETCGICLEELNIRGEIYVYMPNCDHEFHDFCISMWLTRSKSCPLCRAFADYDD